MAFPAARRLRSSVRRQAISIATCAVLVTMSVQMAPPVAAAEGNAESAKPATYASVTRPHAPTAVPSLSTGYSNTVDNHDGTYTASVSSSPINYQPSAGAAWTPIDLTLGPKAGSTNGRLRTAKTPVPVEVGAPDDSDGFVSVDTGDGVIRLRLAPGAKPGKAGSRPSASNGRAKVPGLLDGVDLQVLPTAQGDRLFLTLASRPTSSTFTFALDSGGLTPALQSDGSISFTDKAGKLVATMPAPYATDSTPNASSGGGRYTNKVSYKLTKQGNQTLLTVTVDTSWLASAVYPVYVDPSTESIISGPGPTYNASISNYYNSYNFNGYYNGTQYEMWLGTDPGNSANYNYALLKYVLPSALSGASVNSAYLEVYPYWQYTHYGAVNVWMNQITANWDVHTVTWNNQPATETGAGNGPIAGTTTQGVYSAINVMPFVQNWANNPSSNYGIELRQQNGDASQWKRLISSFGASSQVPILDITYSTPGATPTTTSNGAWTNSRSLGWAYNPYGGPAQSAYYVQVATDSNFTHLVADPGWQSGTANSYSIPTSTTLTDRATYYWRLFVSDGKGQSGSGWMGPWSFRWEASPPATVSFSTPAAQVDQATTSAAFAWNAVNDQALTGYEVASYWNAAANGVCPTSNWTLIGDATQTATSINVSGASGYCYRVAVRSLDQFYSSAWVNSPPILVDSTTPAATVGDNCATIGGCFRNDNTIYFNPNLTPTGPLVLTSMATDNISGIARSTFGALGAGWSYAGGQVSGSQAQASIPWNSSSGNASLTVTVTDGAGVTSATTTINLVSYTGPTAANFWPVSGPTPTYVKPSTAYTISWNETTSGSPITVRSLVQQTATLNSDGTCGTTWTAGSAIAVASAGGPVSTATFDPTGLQTGLCYDWQLTLTDALGTHVYTTAIVIVDATPPVAAISSPGANSAQQGTFTITGTATDAHFTSYTLTYGAGTAPTSWTPIGQALYTTQVGAGGTLGTWVTGSLPAGVYTVALTVVDAAGNSSPPTTTTVYVDNTERGNDSYYTKQNFDMGGGWNLGVNVVTGEASLNRNLFSIPSYGPAQALSLAYNSSDTSTTGRFGTGWSSNLTQYLDVSSLSAGFIVWHRADGGHVIFGNGGGTTWTAAAGHYETLVTANGGYKITYADQDSLTFDSAGHLDLITDRFGTSLTIAWINVMGTLSGTATDASGRVTTIVVNATGNITSVTDSAGRQWSFVYSGSNLTKITDPLGNPTNFAYPSNQLSVSRPRSGQTITWSVGFTAGQAISVTDPIGGGATPPRSSSFSYGSSTTVNVLRDLSGPIYDQSTYYFDPLGRVTSALDPDGYTSTAQYDANGNVTRSTRQISGSGLAVTTAQYDAAGNQVETKDPMGSETVRTFNATNDLVSETEANGTSYALTTAYAYDSQGHLCRKVVNPQSDFTGSSSQCSVTLAGNSDQDIATGYTYNSHNQVLATTDPLGVVTLNGYDDTTGNLTSVIRNYISGGAVDDSTNIMTSYSYDAGIVGGAAGLVTSVKEKVTTVGLVYRTTTYTYDNMGSVLSETDPGDSSVPGTTTVSSYDEFGNRLSQTEYSPTGSSVYMSRVTTVYDLRNRPTSVTTATTVATTTTTTTYDVAGNALLVTNPDNSTLQKSYDGLGRVVSEQKTGLAQTTHAYDGLGDETCTIAPASGNSTVTTTSTCTAPTTGSPTGAQLATKRSFDADGHLISETDDLTGTPATKTQSYDLLGRVYSSTDSAGITTATTYDGASRVIETVATDTVSTDPNYGVAVETDTTYDKDGHVLTASAPYKQSGGTKVITASAYDPLGRACRNVGNATTDLTTLQHPCRDTLTGTTLTNLDTQTYYDAAGDVVATVGPTGIVTRTLVDIKGEDIETITNCVDTTYSGSPATCTGSAPATSTVNVVTTHNSTSSGNQLTTNDFSGTVTTTKTYDGAGRVLTSIVDPGGAGHLNLETDYVYDTKGRQLAEKSPTGVVTINIYDSSTGRQAETIANCSDATPGAVPGSNWASCTGIGAHDGTWNQTTYYWYDSAGNQQVVQAPNGTQTYYAYDTKGEQISRETNYKAGYTGGDATINVTTNYYYDGNGNRIATLAPAASGGPAVRRDFFDGNGRLVKEVLNCTSNGTTVDTNPASCTGLGTMDAQTNVTTTYGYDAAGNQIWMTAPSPANGVNQIGNVTTDYAYDANSHLCRVLENTTQGYLQTLANPCTDAAANSSATVNVSTKYDYDANGHLWHQYAPAPAGMTTYNYDPQGHLLSQTDADGYATTYTYDAAGNRTSETDPDTTSGPTVAYAYDAAGRLCRRVAAPAMTLSGLLCTSSISNSTIDTRYAYFYDTTTGLTTVTAKDALSSEVITATLDQLGRPYSVSGDTAGDLPTTYRYGLAAGVSSETRTDASSGSGSYSFALDAYGRQTNLVDPMHVSNPYRWTYAPNGAVVSSSDPTANTTTNTYDPLGRLTVSKTSGPGCNSCVTYGYTYNNAGNTLSQTSSVNGALANGTTTYAYDALSRLTKYTPPTVAAQSYTWNGLPDRTSITTGVTTLNVTYDAASRPTSDSASGSYASDKEGRITAIPGKTLVYDALGRLTQVKDGSGTTVIATYTYDPLDRLRTVTEGGVRQRFLYAGATAAISQIINDTTGVVMVNHVTDIAGKELCDFTPGGTSQMYLGRDAHGDVTWTADSSGAISSIAFYDPFGNLNTAASTGSVPNSRWQSSWQDTTTGLYYVVARWYAPTLGEFLSTDPLTASADNPQSRDPYSYVAGNPLAGVDPDGRQAQCNYEGSELVCKTCGYFGGSTYSCQYQTSWGSSPPKITGGSTYSPQISTGDQSSGGTGNQSSAGDGIAETAAVSATIAGPELPQVLQNQANGAAWRVQVKAAVQEVYGSKYELNFGTALFDPRTGDPVTVNDSKAMPNIWLKDVQTGRIVAVIKAGTGQLRYVKDIMGKITRWQEVAAVANNDLENLPAAAAFYKQAGEAGAQILETTPGQLAEETGIPDQAVIDALSMVRDGEAAAGEDEGGTDEGGIDVGEFMGYGGSAMFFLSIFAQVYADGREQELARKYKALEGAIVQADNVDPIYTEMLAHFVPMPGFEYDCEGDSCTYMGHYYGNIA